TSFHPHAVHEQIGTAVTCLARDHELLINLPLLTKDGRTLDYEFSLTMMDDAAGQPQYICSVGRDVTERQAIARVLRDSEEKYRLLAENITDVIWVCDLQFNFSYMSPSVNMLLGYTPEECIAIAPRGTLTPEAIAVVQQAMMEELAKEAAHAGQAATRTLLIDQIHRDGRIIHTEAVCSFVRDHAETVTGVMGVTHDITERRRAEEQLRASEEKFSKAFHSAAVLMAISTTDTGRYIDVNRTFLTVLGFARDEVVGHTSGELNVFALSPVGRNELLERLQRDGMLNNLELPVRARDGSQRMVLASVEQITIDGVPCLLTAMVDITARKQAEAALRESEERYRSIFNNATEGIFQSTPQGRYLQMNPAFARMFGYDSPEAMCREVTDISRIYADP
ncbi:MAG TPA: PAS domain S-box protein, partial [bacterium]|nr:PAS domain S-box protein [bacterium]